jgi:hypothetical protein
VITTPQTNWPQGLSGVALTRVAAMSLARTSIKDAEDVMNERLSKNQTPSDVSEYLDRLQESKGTNRDADGLGPMAVGPIIIGKVDAIHGETGKEVPEFPATGHELIQLAKYGMLERIECDFDWFLFQSIGSTEWRWSEYIDRRLDRLYQVLGREMMRKAQEDAVALFRQRHPDITDEDWRAFTEGTDDEQEAWQERVL